MFAPRAWAVAAGLGLFVVVHGGTVSAVPVLEPAASEVDVGSLIRGASGEAVFTLRNTGDETLRILGAEPG